MGPSQRTISPEGSHLSTLYVDRHRDLWATDHTQSVNSNLGSFRKRAEDGK